MNATSASASLRERARDVLLRKVTETVQSWPCSEGQTSLWYLHQAAPHSAAYNVGFALAIEGAVDPDRLERACQALVDRHSILRARFENNDGELVQKIVGYERVTLAEKVVEDGSQEALREAVEAYHGAPFDLESGPLYRFTLFRQAPDAQVLLVTAHHIVCDGWTLWLLMDELGERYGGGSDVADGRLRPLQTSYRDYVLKERSMLDLPASAASWSYWEKRLAGAPPALNLPLAKQRPAVQVLNGLSCPVRLGPALTEAVRRRAREAEITPFAFLLTAFQVLLHRYSSESDILVGIPMAGMRDGAYARVAGHFVNQLPIRASLESEKGFRAIARETLQQLLDAREHGAIPFGMLVKRLSPRRNPNCSPVFQSSFVLQGAPWKNSVFALMAPDGETRHGSWGGLRAAHFDFPQQEGQLDVTLELMDGAAEIFGRLKADAALFDVGDTMQLAASFVELLSHAVEEVDCPIGRLRLQSHEERQRCLDAAGAIEGRFEVSTDLGQAFADMAASQPEAIAVNGVGFELTYRELDERADRLAAYLRGRGLAGQRIGLCVERSMEMIVGIVGILKAGCAYVPIDPRSPAERQAFILQDSEVRLLLTRSQPAGEGGPLSVETLCLISDWDSIAQAPAEPASNVTIDPERTAYVIYTSGTTGKPKGVAITHRNVIRLFSATDAYYGFGTGDVWPLLHSFAFDVSVWEIWGAFLYGGRLLVVPHETVRSPDELVDLLLAEGATVLNQTPSAFRLLTKAANLPALAGEGRLRLISFAGEALDPQILRPWIDLAGDEQPRIVNMYGITETTVHAMYRQITADDLKRPSSMIGVPFPDLRIYILDNRLEPVPFGVRGEIFVGGDGVGVGYHNRPELNGQRFIADPFGREPGRRLYRSGDLAVRRRNGDVEYSGRADRQVKLRGFRIELGEIEHMLAGHPDVSSAIVRAVGSGEETRLVGYVIPRPGSDVSGQNLRQHAFRLLPEYMVPSDIVFLDALPLNANGKIDEGLLPLPQATTGDGGVALVPPRDWTEQRLLRIWQQLLKREAIGIEDNFFELGGHSFLAVSMMADIESTFGKKLPISALMGRQTVARLAELLRDEAASGRWSPIVPIREEPNGRKFFCVAGGGGNVVYFYHLARYLPEGIAFYGVQSYGLGGAPPKSSVEEAARAYVEEIRAVQGTGPYLLGGHCFGGWVAYEIGRQLVEMGEQVEVLAVLDAPGPGLSPSCAAVRHDRNDPQWVVKFVKAFTEGTEASMDFDPEVPGATQDELLEQLSAGFERAGFVPFGAGAEQVKGLFNVFLANSTAVYAPVASPTLPIALFRAAEFHRDYDYSAVDDEARSFGWSMFSSGPVAVHDAPGNHISMLCEPNVAELSNSLARVLTQWR